MKFTTSLFLLLVAFNMHAKPLNIGDPAPDFEATTLSGNTIHLSQLKGKPIYLKFWATWCHYCLAEMPYLDALKKKYGEELQVLTINVGINDSVNNINAYFQKNNFDLATVFDSQGQITQDYGVIGTPYHILLTKEAKVAYTSFLHSDQIELTIATLMAQGE